MPKRAIAAYLGVIVFFCFLIITRATGSDAVKYSYVIINSYPHDPMAFTQGLVWDQGIVYEGTGKIGRSSLRRVDLPTGLVKQKIDYTGDIYGEGITFLGNTIYQLTWKNHLAFAYDKHDFSLVKSFEYPRQGWGITHDDQSLIASDGTSTLYFLDPENLAEKRKIIVHDNSQDIKYLNELEYINGLIYANIYRSKQIAIIDPVDGLVQGWIDLTGLHNQLNLQNDEAVLNGIMYDKKGDRLFVTGKFWPKIFEIKLFPE